MNYSDIAVTPIDIDDPRLAFAPCPDGFPPEVWESLPPTVKLADLKQERVLALYNLCNRDTSLFVRVVQLVDYGYRHFQCSVDGSMLVFSRMPVRINPPLPNPDEGEVVQ